MHISDQCRADGCHGTVWSLLARCEKGDKVHWALEEVIVSLYASEVLDALEWRGGASFARVVFAVPHARRARPLARRLPPRASATGPLILFTYLLVRCICLGCVRVTPTWPCVHGVGP